MLQSDRTIRNRNWRYIKLLFLVM